MDVDGSKAGLKTENIKRIPGVYFLNAKAGRKYSEITYYSLDDDDDDDDRKHADHTLYACNDTPV